MICDSLFVIHFPKTNANHLMEDDLFTLHESFLETLGPDEEVTYLLDCQEFLKSGDLCGWKEKFRGPEEVTKPVSKKKRGSPSELFWSPNSTCGECHSSEVIDDIVQGQIVCTNCGLIQSLHLYTSEARPHVEAHAQTASFTTIHRYSRVVYFRSVIQSLMGETSPVMSQEEVERLRSIYKEPFTPQRTLSVLKKTGLLRLRRHCVRLTDVLSGGSFSPLVVEHEHFVSLLKKFRLVEYWFNNSSEIKELFGKRKVFFSYPYLFYQLCFDIGCMQYSGTHHLLKGKALLGKQHKIYGFLCKKAGLSCNLAVYR